MPRIKPKLRSFFGSPHIQIALATGISIIVMAFVSKRMLHRPIGYLPKAIPPFIMTIYEAIVQRFKGRRICTAWYWVVAIFTATALVIAFHASAGDDAKKEPAGLLYLGESPPGRVPEVFAAGRISGAGFRLHGSPVFSPDLRVVYWPVIPPTVMFMSFSNGSWSKAIPAPLPGRGVQAPAFSPDGRRLYYQCVMEGGRGGLDIWWTERTGDGWGEPVNAGPVLNSEGLESQPSVTADGTLYFTGTLEGVGFDRGIYRSRIIDGSYSAPELLGGGINSEYIDYCPWIAPDESYLLFASSRPNTDEVLYLYVSFRGPDGSWSEPANIHPALGFDEPAGFPTVSPDGRFLFFLSRGKVYWVDAAGVMELRRS